MTFSLIDVPALRQHIADGLTDQQAGAKLGVHQDTVRRARHRYGIIRHRKEPKRARSMTPDQKWESCLRGREFESATVSPARFMPTSSRSITIGSLSGCAAAMCAG